MRALAGIAPCFTVVESATGYGDWGTPAEHYQVPKDLAIALGEHLAAAGIDIAMAPDLRLDHGFGQSTHDLFGSLSAVPLIPIVINCVDRPHRHRRPYRRAGHRDRRLPAQPDPSRRACPGHRLGRHLPRTPVADTRAPATSPKRSARS